LRLSRLLRYSNRNAVCNRQKTLIETFEKIALIKYYRSQKSGFRSSTETKTIQFCHV